MEKRKGEGEENVPVKCPVSVVELKEEGRGCLAVDFGGERLRGHCQVMVSCGRRLKG